MTDPAAPASPASPLLEPDEPPAFEVVNSAGAGRTVLSCDHASPRLPRRLGDLGVSEADRLTHIGWDIGAALVARRLSELVDAPLALAGYSRLAIDCNRPPGSPTSIPETTGGVDVPGNRGLPPAHAAERAEALFWPYHRAIEALLDARRDAGRPPCFVAVHSFTPALLGRPRPWRAGLLYNRDRRLADLFRASLAREPDLLPLGDNEPYRVTDAGDFGVPVHAERRGIPHVLFEIRQDEIDHPAGVEAWAARLAGVVRAAEAQLFGGGGEGPGGLFALSPKLRSERPRSPGWNGAARALGRTFGYINEVDHFVVASRADAPDGARGLASRGRGRRKVGVALAPSARGGRARQGGRGSRRGAARRARPEKVAARRRRFGALPRGSR